MLTTQSAIPHPALRPFVHCYVQRAIAPKTQIIEPVFPRAGTMLIFQFAKVYEVKEFGTELPRRSWGATVIGPILSRKTRLILDDQLQSLDVIFRPAGLFHLFGVPVSLLTGGGTEAHAVFGPHIATLHQRLGNEVSFSGRVQLLNGFFLHLLVRARLLDGAARAFGRLASGSCNVGEAAKMTGISERQFERRSLVWTGMTPKTLAKVSRFQRAIREYQSSNSNWLRTAHAVGYYDQMHLISDFHELGRGTPTEVIAGIEPGHLISFCCR